MRLSLLLCAAAGALLLALGAPARPRAGDTLVVAPAALRLSGLRLSVRRTEPAQKRRPPLRGVGGAFIGMAIAVVTLLVLHFALREVSVRKKDVMSAVENDSEYSDVWISTTQGEARAESDSASSVHSNRGFGKRLRESLSFKLPNGTWLHEDKGAREP